jgi:hypothetical protein
LRMVSLDAQRKKFTASHAVDEYLNAAIRARTEAGLAIASP